MVERMVTLAVRVQRGGRRPGRQRRVAGVLLADVLAWPGCRRAPSSCLAQRRRGSPAASRWPPPSTRRDCLIRDRDERRGAAVGPRLPRPPRRARALWLRLGHRRPGRDRATTWTPRGHRARLVARRAPIATQRTSISPARHRRAGRRCRGRWRAQAPRRQGGGARRRRPARWRRCSATTPATTPGASAGVRVGPRRRATTGSVRHRRTGSARPRPTRWPCRRRTARPASFTPPGQGPLTGPRALPGAPGRRWRSACPRRAGGAGGGRRARRRDLAHRGSAVVLPELLRAGDHPPVRRRAHDGAAGRLRCGRAGCTTARWSCTRTSPACIPTCRTLAPGSPSPDQRRWRSRAASA